MGLKLYVWTDVLKDYTPGIAFALAATEDEARELVVKKALHSTYVEQELAGKPQVFDPEREDAGVVFIVYGGG
jgi:hypothetical protein